MTVPKQTDTIPGAVTDSATDTTHRYPGAAKAAEAGTNTDFSRALSPATEVQPQLQQEAEPQKQVHTQAQPRVQSQEQPPVQVPVQPPAQTDEQPQTQPQVSVLVLEQVPAVVHVCRLETPPDTVETSRGMEKTLPEPVGTQVSMEESQKEPASGLDMRECKNRVQGAGGSLKVTILQSSDRRAFRTIPLTLVPCPSDSAFSTPEATGTLSKQALQFFCYICKASCSS
ncbi:Cip1-interacting zinc finger protein [Plecturocebus cupreus]